MPTSSARARRLLNTRCKVLHIKPLRAKAERDEESKKRLEQNGFRHYDVIKSHKRTVGNFRGMITGLNEKWLVVKTQASKQTYASYQNSHVLYSPKSLVYY